MVAVYKVLKTSGKVVFLSATILAASFFGLSFVDVPMVSSIGIGGAVVVLSTMVVNLTLVPSLLILIGPYLYSCHGCSSSGSSDNYIKNADSLLPNGHNNDPLGTKQDIVNQRKLKDVTVALISAQTTQRYFKGSIIASENL